MKRWKTTLLTLTSCLFTRLSAAPINDIGPLTVVGNEIRGKDGQVARLRGMSFYWSQAKAGRDFYNADVVNWLAEDWHCNIVRAAMAVEGDWSATEKGYLSDPTTNKERVKTIVDAAIAKGIYVIIDWHDHNATNHQSQAVSFFSEMASTYKDYPNVIYEIFNEPQEDSWESIKTYSVAVIEAIRQHDKTNLIVVGTRRWSSEVAEASRSPITGYSNLAYTFHFYASEKWHYDHYMAKADSALNNGVALFVTEWGNSQASGDGNLNYTYMNAFMDWMESKKLSWCNWSISDLSETSSALKAGTWGSQGNLTHTVSINGSWSESDLSASGVYTRDKMRSFNPSWESVVSVLKSRVSLPSSPLTIKNGFNGVNVIFSENHTWQKAQFFDTRGRLLYSTVLRPAQESLNFDTGALSSGYVLLRIYGDGTSRILPIVP